MGRIAATLSDLAIATSDNPRTEDPAAILTEIERGLTAGPAEWAVIPDRREAIRAAVRRAEAGDVVLIAGKGHETYQIIGTQALPFDDRAVARAILLDSPPGGDSGTAGTVQ
jgi:UDP-N-acetylmuramoyl-L-alanyl-D-glutamate--2,6-diaminopimelate ligase